MYKLKNLCACHPFLKEFIHSIKENKFIGLVGCEFIPKALLKVFLRFQAPHLTFCGSILSLAFGAFAILPFKLGRSVPMATAGAMAVKENFKRRLRSMVYIGISKQIKSCFPSYNLFRHIRRTLFNVYQ